MSDSENKAGAAGSTADVHRRDFLRVGGAGAVALSLGALGCHGGGGAAGAADGAIDAATPDGAVDAGAPDAAPFDPEGVPQDDARFPTAVLAGAMTAEGALIRGQVDGAGGAWLRVWADGGPGGFVVDRRVEADEGFFKVALDGLAADTRYAFAFFEMGPDGVATARSPVGRFRTAPPPDARPALTIGATACTNRRFAPYRSLGVLAREPFDVFCHLGDMSYNDGAATRADFRAKWRWTLQEENYRAVFAKAGMYQTWDDHEIANNDELYTLPREVIDAGLDAFFEACPAARGPDGQLWTSHRWGGTAEIFVLDCRLERRPETRETAGALYVSRAQMDWLKRAVAESPCHFKILLNSVPITHLAWPFEEDRWQGYAAQRDELLDHLDAAGVDNVWFLSGDLHLGLVGRVDPPGGARRNRWEILCGHGASYGNPLALAATRSETQRERFLPPDQFLHFNLDFAATTLTFDPADDSVRVRFLHAETEEVLFDRVLRESDA